MTVRTPNYVLNQAYTFNQGPHDSRELPAGAFVRPLMFEYVPKHIIEKFKTFTPEYDVFCYCRYGIIPIPKSLLREV